jgi:hypothetical protein
VFASERSLAPIGIDVAFRTLLILREGRKSLNLNVFFDVLLIGTCLAPGYYLVRTLLQIYGYEELTMLKYEWLPILLAGIAFALWVVESAYFDLTGNFSVQTSGIRDATLFASVSIFAIGTARFAETWGGYVKGMNVKRKMLARGRGISNPLEEQA